MMGSRISFGTLVSFTKRRISEYPMQAMMILASSRPIKIAYTSGAFSMNSSGPGCRPCTISAPIMMAVAPSPGMPRVSTGIKAPPLTALFPASGAATPSGSPYPKFSLCLLHRLAWS